MYSPSCARCLRPVFTSGASLVLPCQNTTFFYEDGHLSGNVQGAEFDFSQDMDIDHFFGPAGLAEEQVDNDNQAVSVEYNFANPIDAINHLSAVKPRRKQSNKNKQTVKSRPRRSNRNKQSARRAELAEEQADNDDQVAGAEYNFADPITAINHLSTVIKQDPRRSIRNKKAAGAEYNFADPIEAINHLSGAHSSPEDSNVANALRNYVYGDADDTIVVADDEELTSLPASPRITTRAAARAPITARQHARNVESRLLGMARKAAREDAGILARGTITQEELVPAMLPFIKQRPGGVIKVNRPPNSFILYREDKAADAKAEAKAVAKADRLLDATPKALSVAWRNESPAVKREYAQRAADMAEQHRVLFPSYAFMPDRRRR